MKTLFFIGHKQTSLDSFCPVSKHSSSMS